MAATPPDLGPAEVHVWRASLDVDAPASDALLGYLDGEEVARAARFPSPIRRARFVVAHATLRLILAEYLGQAPARVRLEREPGGRPFLAVGEGSTAPLRFSMSHSHDLGVFAFARDHALGIDLERLRQDLEVRDIVSHFFSRQEREALSVLPRDLWQAAFFHVWTQKEAYLKATGKGLDLPLEDVTVRVNPSEGLGILEVRGSPEEGTRWRLESVPAASGYWCVVAAPAFDWRLCCWDATPVLARGTRVARRA